MKSACAACRRSVDRLLRIKQYPLWVRTFFRSLFFAFLCLALLSGQAAAAACPSFSNLIHNGSYGVADRGTIISGCNLDTPLVPASIIKLSTALAGFAVLGPEYRFSTFFYLDDQDNLYIRGTGDPLLISEEIERIFIALRAREITRINGIFVDPSLFALEHQVPGRQDSANPYDAPVGPVAVNFNSVPVKVSAKRTIISSEPQTPTLPLMQEVAKNFLPGRYRINICAGGCNPDKRMARYTTELFRALQHRAGITGSGPEGIRRVPESARLIYEHKNSKGLQYLTGAFLKYSSNFISNLVFLACGAQRFGYPATWDKGRRAVREVLVRQLGEETAAAIHQVEGAGLSRENRVTARAMLELLEVFRPHADLLRKRMGVLTKSGSMKGIYNYGGYLRNGRTYVIILNQRQNTRRAILARLKKGRYPVTGEVRR